MNKEFEICKKINPALTYQGYLNLRKFCKKLNIPVGVYLLKEREMKEEQTYSHPKAIDGYGE